MVNPTLIKKSSEAENPLIPTEEVKKLFQVIHAEQNRQEADNDDIPKIKVSTLVSKMAFFYEKLRNTVDYKEEHLLRKNAIDRIISRQVQIQGVLKKAMSADVARDLLTELIRADYLPNNRIPESKIDDIAAIIDKYFLLRSQALSAAKFDYQAKQDLTDWIIAMAACEVEASLGRRDSIDVVVNYMFQTVKQKIEFPDSIDSAKDKDIQIFLGVHRNYLKFDRDMLSYILLKYYVAGWPNADAEKIRETAAGIRVLRQDIDAQLDHPLVKQIDRAVSRYTVFFSVLVGVIAEDPIAVYNYFRLDPKAFPRAIKRVCAKKYAVSKSKLWRAGVRSIIYLFLTKAIMAFILEVPVANFIGEKASGLSLFVNIAFPPFLLFLIIFFTKLPSDSNTDKIVQGISEIIFAGKADRNLIKLRRPAPRSSKLTGIFTLLYALTFFASFGFVVWVLRRIDFNLISIIIFVFFLTLVSFFSIRIRKSTKELMVVEPKESLFTLLGDFFYTPILEVGKWLSERFSKINVFIFVLDFIIETPFKVFVNITDEWSKYVKERRDEIG